MSKLLRKEIVVFYILSCAISWPFMIWMQFFDSSWNSIPLPQPIKTSLFMWGPGISALFSWKYLKKYHNLNRYNLFTGGRVVNIIIYTMPMFLFVLIFNNKLDTNQILFFLTIYNLISFLNTFGEELGWRGYLQPNLTNMSTTKRYFILGLMWELWHLPMRIGALYNGANILYIVLFSIGTILITYIMGIFVERTKSVSIAISLHVTINSVISLSSISKIPQHDLTPFFLIILLFYLIVYLTWNRIRN